MRKKRCSAIIVLFVAVFMLSGCQEEKTQERVILTILAGQTTADAGIEDMIDQLIQEKYPYVTLDWETVDWGEEFDGRLRADFAASDVPDIIIGKAQDVNAYYKTGHLGEIDKTLVANVTPDVLKDVTIDGKIYGIPYNQDYQGVLYNKDLFKRLNLTVPSTFEELKKVVNMCKANHITPFAYSYQNESMVTMNTMQSMLNEVFKYDGTWGKKFWLGMVFMDQSNEVAQCLKNNEYMMQNSWSDISQVEQYECDMRFGQGEAAMYMTSTWSLSNILQYGEGRQFGIFPFPNTESDAELVKETNLTFMKNADTKYATLVNDILKTILEDQKLCSEISEFTQTIPTASRLHITYPPALQADIDYYEKQGKVINALSGYNQLNWNYMNEVTEKQIEWLSGHTTIKEVLYYAELKRSDSVI